MRDHASQPAVCDSMLVWCLGADIICLQETKLARSEAARELALEEGWCALRMHNACVCSLFVSAQQLHVADALQTALRDTAVVAI